MAVPDGGWRMADGKNRFCHPPSAVCHLLQTVQLFHKCIYVFESPVDGREPHVRDRVESAQALHHQSAEALRRNLAFRPFLHVDLDRVRNAIQLRLRNRPLATRDLQPAHQLIAVIRLPPLIAFHHMKERNLDFFVRREAPRTPRALPSPANDVALAALPRVDDAILEICAEGTTHWARYITGERSACTDDSCAALEARLWCTARERRTQNVEVLKPSPQPFLNSAFCVLRSALLW